MSEPSDPKKYVVLQGIEHGNCFYSLFIDKDRDPTITIDGKVSYNLIGYASTGDQARAMITEHTGKSDNQRLFEWIAKQRMEMHRREIEAIETGDIVDD